MRNGLILVQRRWIFYRYRFDPLVGRFSPHNLSFNFMFESFAQFEEMIDRLEKSSGQTVITLGEAKSLLKQDDDFIMAVYDYWLNKRLKMVNERTQLAVNTSETKTNFSKCSIQQHPLIPQVKTEKYGGTGSSSNPYIAFRRRTEKMQTRKHRKNDEASYEKMLKLRRDLSRALTLLEMVKKREKCKRENVHFGIEIYEKRYQLADYSGQVINELTSQVKQQQPRPSFTPLSTIHGSNVWPNQTPPMVGNVPHNQTHNHRPSSYKVIQFPYCISDKLGGG